jgi:hypothetical protein
VEEEKSKPIGFIASEFKKAKINPYVDEILPELKNCDYYQERLNDVLARLRQYDYHITVDIKAIDYEIYHRIVKELSNFDNFRPHKRYVYKINKNRELVKTLKRS